VQLALPINSLEQSPQGMLAAASDAQVLTFVDIRERHEQMNGTAR
jgi:hypothetical protein